MGRAVHYRVHALTGLASAKRNTEDESCLTFARSLIPRPVQAAKAYSARDFDHDDMRKLRWHARVNKRAHLPALPEEFERRRLVQLTGKDSSWAKRWQTKMQPHGTAMAPASTKYLRQRSSMPLGW